MRMGSLVRHRGAMVLTCERKHWGVVEVTCKRSHLGAMEVTCERSHWGAVKMTGLRRYWVKSRQLRHLGVFEVMNLKLWEILEVSNVRH